MLRITQPFWRTEQLSHPERRLLNAVLLAHAASASRENASSVTVRNAAAGSGDYCNAIAAGLLCLGGPHAPIAETMDLLESDNPSLVALRMLKSRKVPGWGNSFTKGAPDPLWRGVYDILESDFNSMSERIFSVTSALHAAGKSLYPNPSCYTAAAAIITKLPKPFAPYLFIAGRLDGWSKLLIQPE